MSTATLLPARDIQLINEQTYNRKHIDGYIKEEIEANPDVMAKVYQGVQLLNDWMNQPHYESKEKRLKQLETLDLEQLVIDIFVGVAYCQKPELFTSVTSQLASKLKFSDRPEAIQTIAEITAVLCYTDAFDIGKANEQASLQVLSNIPLSSKLLGYIAKSAYLPPMLCQPRKLRSNYQSAYLTHNDSLILGKGNHHDGDICLDVLNTQNSVKLKLDTDFLSTIEEEPKEAPDTAVKWEQWQKHKLESYRMYSLIAKQGNCFHLTHKVDKRGRIYAQGYHISTQGTAFKKAAIELYDEEIVTGVPTN
jgi:hypothetical protein